MDGNKIMRATLIRWPIALLASLHLLSAQGTVPTFDCQAGHHYSILGGDLRRGTNTTVPTVLVPITLAFDAKKIGGKPFIMDAAADVPRVLTSPIFADFPFANGRTQYVDAMLRATFANASGHTLLGRPSVKPITIGIPIGYGYVLTSKQSGRSFAIADLEYVQREIFKQIARQDGSLIIAVTRNTAFYALGDATVCCAWGTHGVDTASGNSFVLASYLQSAPSVVEDQDVQPLTMQLAEFANDPLHDPLARGGRNVEVAGNTVPGWMRPGFPGACGGTGVGSTYFLLQPTNTNPKNNIPASRAFVAAAGGVSYHLQKAALLPWYIGPSEDLAKTFSFPDPTALAEPARPCGARGGGGRGGPAPSSAAIPAADRANGHKLIGYWVGYSAAGSMFSLRDVSPQWDVILVAFATPDANAPEGTMQFHTPAGMETGQFKSDIAYLKSRGKRVMISLGGGGQHFTLADPNRVPNFVASVSRIVSDYGFDGIDIDFESPSLSIDPGDTDFRKPITPSIVNLIRALRQIHDRFGPGFMISLVPEGTQIPSGLPSYGGQFGSYLPIAYAIRDILSFIDVQSYNTPPLEGLDGEIYQPGTVDYHAAMTELLLHGFNVGGDPKELFPALPADKVAVGFLTGDTTPAIVSQAMEYLITAKAPPGTSYKLRAPKGYPAMMGAMFWTIDADRRGNYDYSNKVGPQLHAYPDRR